VFDVVGKRNWFFLFSLLLTIPGLVFILLTPFTDAGLKFTIDYTGGTRWVIRFEDPAVEPQQVRDVFLEENLEATVVRTSTGFVEIKTEPIGLAEEPAPVASPGASVAPSGSPSSASPSGSADPSAAPSAGVSAGPDASTSASASAEPSPSVSPSASIDPSASPSPSPTAAAPVGNTTIPTDGELGRIGTILQERFGPIAEQQSLSTVGPVVSSDLIGQALTLILVGSLGIAGWITYRFRDVKFGVTAIVTLVHDVIVVVGTFAILGTFFGVEIDALFVTAMLTVIGFSIHDTIVVFDRIRENKARHAGEPFADIVNHSILQTAGRSITTSLTVGVTLLALILFGGSATTYFVLALLLGLIIGTYSSIFNAAQLLVEWQVREDRRHGRLPVPRVAGRASP